MPLLMGCTKPSSIVTEEVERSIIYEPISQKVIMDFRMIGTRCLKTGSTRVSTGGGRGYLNKIDRKNEIDDSKYVK